MREEKVHFRSGNYEIEGLYQDGNTATGVVVTHPHPLYGGDMYNPVVEAIVTAYQNRGFATLRFDFRGTGNSTGSHAQGIGEQTDVAGAVDFLKSRAIETIHLSGYSFGTWVNAMAVTGGLPTDGMTMVAPPVAFMAFGKGIRLPLLSLVVAGGRDEFGPPYLIRPAMDRWNPDARLDILPDADHFFFGYLDELAQKLVDSIQAPG
jgi:alpha/beta superfamily hydrolase